MKKLLVMQSQLELDSKQYALEIQDRLEAKEDLKAECDELRQDRLAAKEERAAEREALKQEHADCAANRQEQKEERAERQAIHDFQEKELQD
jgi:hypothetical protein